jgi:hypothetical protein
MKGERGEVVLYIRFETNTACRDCHSNFTLYFLSDELLFSVKINTDILKYNYARMNGAFDFQREYIALPSYDRPLTNP